MEGNIIVDQVRLSLIICSQEDFKHVKVKLSSKDSL